MTLKLEVEHLYKQFGDLPVLQDINLSIDSGGFISVVGPSGCGKTTFLRIVAGLEQCRQPFLAQTFELVGREGGPQGDIAHQRQRVAELRDWHRHPDRGVVERARR